MKKYFLLAVFAILTFISSSAIHRGSYVYEEDGEVSIRIELKSDGLVSMVDYQNGTRFEGTYRIDDNNIKPGETKTIYFNLNGQTYRGTLMWPIEEGLCLSFDGLFFDKTHR